MYIFLFGKRNYIISLKSLVTTNLTKRHNIPGMSAALMFLSAFVFFATALPYCLMRREQLNLFLFDSDYIRETYHGVGWLSRFAGDFFDQFLCYRIVGPILVALVLTAVGEVVYKISRKAFSPGVSRIVALFFFVWAVMRETDSRYLSQYTISTLGYLSLFMAALHFREKWMKPVAAAVFLSIGIWAFGVPCQKYYGKLWSRPNFTYDKVIGMDVEASRENWDKVLRISDRNEMHITEVDYYYNLAWAMKGALGDKMLDHSQNYANGVLLTVAENESPFTNGMAGEAWYQLGDMSLAEQSTMIALQASPKQTGTRFLKRLAELNLISGETATAQKFLTMLSKTMRYRKWALRMMPENHDDEITQWLEQSRSKLARTDFVYGDADYRPVLKGLVESNPENHAAREYLLCYDLMYFDVPSFMEDYNDRRIPGRMYDEAFLIGLSLDGLSEERAMGEGVNPQTYKRMQNYFRNPERYKNSYWYYYANSPIAH